MVVFILICLSGLFAFEHMRGWALPPDGRMPLETLDANVNASLKPARFSDIA